MLLFFRLPFVLLEMVLRQGVRGLATVVQLLRGGEAHEPAAAPTPYPGAGSARTAAGYASAAATAVVDVAEDLAERGMELVQDEPEEAVVVEEEPAEAPQGPPPPSAEEAIERRRAREAEAQVAPPVNPPEEPAPLRGLDADEHVDREPELVESFGPSEDVHGAITVEEPWDGYDAMAATAVVSRLRGADDATRAVVRLYEQTHKKRQTILRATG